MFYQYLQWQIDLQLAGAQQWARDRHLSIGLYHDLALATDRFGSDLWAHRPFYVAGCRVGSPPDDFSPKGQDWAFPPPNSARHREDGYRLFAESIRKNCRHGGALRIDHVMRLFRLFWIPDGVEATEGAYVRERNDDFVRILALESVRNQVVVVGEDLGTVEPSIRETLARFGILSYRLFYFEKNERGEFRRSDEYPRQSLVSSTTHDLPTLAGFWVGADIAARRAAGIIDDEVQRAQLEQRRTEKQKMLDVLFQLELVRKDLPRSAEAYAELTGRAAQRHRRVSGDDAFAIAGHQSGGPDQGSEPAESAGEHLAVSQLGTQDALHHRAVARGCRDARVYHDVSRLDRALGPPPPPAFPASPPLFFALLPPLGLIVPLFPASPRPRGGKTAPRGGGNFVAKLPPPPTPSPAPTFPPPPKSTQGFPWPLFFPPPFLGPPALFWAPPLVVKILGADAARHERADALRARLQMDQSVVEEDVRLRLHAACGRPRTEKRVAAMVDIAELAREMVEQVLGHHAGDNGMIADSGVGRSSG